MTTDDTTDTTGSVAGAGNADNDHIDARVLAASQRARALNLAGERLTQQEFHGDPFADAPNC